MEYTSEQVQQLKRDKETSSRALVRAYRDLILETAPKLRIEKAREYLTHGVGRRLKIVARCLDKVFEIFPPDRKDILNSDEVADLEIHLHAFVINVNGLLDNLAWVFVLERNLLEAVGGRIAVGLFKKETRAHLPEDVQAYLMSEKIRDWHLTYAKEYRDALAHRIPLYIPPSVIDPKDAERHRQLDGEMFQAMLDGDIDLADSKKSEQAALESVCLTAVHSYSESQMVWIHAQMVADANTALAVTGKIRKHLATPSN